MPGGASSNADQIAAKLRAMADNIRFDATVGDKGLGRDMAAAVGTGIAARSLQDQTDPAGNAWPANKGKYGRKKRKKGLPVGVGPKQKDPKGRPMLSVVELSGVPEVRDEGKSLVIKYGTSPEVRRKGMWFEGGSSGANGCEPSGAPNQPPRKFYGLDATIRENLAKLAREYFRRILKRVWGK